MCLSCQLPGADPTWQVNAHSGVPVWSIAVCTVFSLLLALINIGSTAAFNAIISLVLAGFLSSYLISVGLLLHRRWTGDAIRWGPWSMGRWGGAVNVLSIAYVVITLIFSFFPGTAVVTLVNMNWSALVFGAVLLFSVAFYLVSARRTFQGPIDEVRNHQDLTV